LLILLGIVPAHTQSLTLYVDTETKQVYTEPGEGRVKIGDFRRVEEEAGTENKASEPSWESIEKRWEALHVHERVENRWASRELIPFEKHPWAVEELSRNAAELEAQKQAIEEELAALTGVPLETRSRTEGRSTRPALMRFARPESLNPDTGSTRLRDMIGLVSWVLGVMVVLFAVPVAAMDPPYERPVADADDVEERLAEALTDLGADDVEPLAVDAGFVVRDCRREEAWFWGGSHGVAHIDYRTTRPVDGATGEAVLARVAEYGSLNTYNDQRGRVGGFLVEVSDGQLEVSGGTGCLSSGDREEVRPVVTDALGYIVAWLTAPE
jgi:hypothetical protein